MKTVTVLEFRKNARQILKWSQQGQRMIMTYRGKPVARIEPIRPRHNLRDDPFFGLIGIAEGKKGTRLTNEDIDRIVYGG